MPYRDGVGAARALVEPELDELRERAEALDEHGRDVPARLRVEIDTLLADSSRPVRSMTEVSLAHARVRELALAIDVASEVAAMTVAARRQRRRARLRSAAVAGGVLALLGATFGASSTRAYAEAECGTRWECADLGLCHASQVDDWVVCVAKNDEDCASACSTRGECVAQAGRCVAATDAACRASRACATEGLCRAEGGACVVADDALCAASSACRDSGRCSADEGAGACEIMRDQDCARSDACTSDHLCAAWGGKCVGVTQKSCRLGAACEARGLCSPEGATCIAQDDGDCQFSRACLDHDRCVAEHGACVRARAR